MMRRDEYYIVIIQIHDTSFRLYMMNSNLRIKLFSVYMPAMKFKIMQTLQI